MDVYNPVGGTVEIEGTNVVFTPNPDFYGLASFNYTITDNGTTDGAADPRAAAGTVSFNISVSTKIAQLAVERNGQAVNLQPVFSRNVTSYAASLNNAANEVRIKPELVNPALAAVKVNGITVNSGEWSDPIKLSAGSNRINLVVTADGSQPTTYTLDLLRKTSASTVPA